MDKNVAIAGSNELAISKEQIEQLTQSLITANKKETRLIRTWDELKEEKSDTHTLEIDEYSGWIKPKVPDKDTSWIMNNHYLSTHTFYGSQYLESTRILQEHGFNVQLENWDGETEWFNMDEYMKTNKQNSNSGSRVAIVGHGGSGTNLNELAKSLAEADFKIDVLDEPMRKTTPYEPFKEQRLYDLLNKMANVRYTMPVFHKCKSCGFLVVDYQLDKNGVCTDCGKVDWK